MTDFKVPTDLDRARLDAALRRIAPELSRTVARRACEVGAVALDGVRAAASDRVRAGATVSLDQATLPLSLALGLAVVHADAALLVVHKPPGLAVHGGPLVDDSVAMRLAEVFPSEGVGLVHRLDRDASGLLALGRSREALRELAAALESGAVRRVYLAGVLGVPAESEFQIDLPLRVLDEPRGDQPKTVVDETDGQPARSEVTVLGSASGASLVAVRLHSGRTHQIRAHLAAVGHPLLGDPRYGDPAANDEARATFGIHRLLLHARELALTSPADGAALDLRATHEPDFARRFRSILVPRNLPAADRSIES